MEQIIIQGKNFKDKAGRLRIFNGMNMVFKGEVSNKSGIKEYIPSWNDTTFRWLAENGFNLIRLGIIWDAIEPEPGKYSENYLDWVDKIIEKCNEYEIYVFLDMHQDLFSEKYSDGAPGWATLDDGLAHFKGDLWSDSYLFSDAVKRAFDRFWANDKLENGEGIQDHYAKMWGMLARRYARHKNLIGYDVMNEPFPGSSGLGVFVTLLTAFAQLTKREMSPEELMEFFANEEEKLKLLAEIDSYELYSAMVDAARPATAGFEDEILDLFYKKVLREIKSNTIDGAFFLENSYFSNMGIKSRVKRIDNDSPQVYSPHGYDLVVDSPAVCIASNQRVDVIFDNHRKVQEKLDVPVIVGEWGAHSKYTEGLGHIKHLLGKFDKFKWSHTYWAYFDGIEKAPVMDILRRPYPVAVPGEKINYGYDYDCRVFTLEWNCDSKDDEVVVYVPEKPAKVSVTGDYIFEPLVKGGKSRHIKIMVYNIGENRMEIIL